MRFGTRCIEMPSLVLTALSPFSMDVITCTSVPEPAKFLAKLNTNGALPGLLFEGNQLVTMQITCGASWLLANYGHLFFEDSAKFISDRIQRKSIYCQ